MLPDTIFIDKALYLPPIQPRTTYFQLNDGNSNISRMVSILPNEFVYSLDVTTNPRGNRHAYDDFAFADNMLQAYLNIEIPLAINIQGLHLQDTIDFLSLSIKNSDKTHKGTFILNVTNSFPLQAWIYLTFLDEWGFPVTFAQGSTPIAASQINPHTLKTEKAVQTKLHIAITAEQMPKILYASQVIADVYLSTKPENKHIQIFSHYTMQIKATADFVYKMKKK